VTQDVVLLGQLINNKKVENEYLFGIEGLWAYEKSLLHHPCR
jgi:hypothetical protein